MARLARVVAPGFPHHVIQRKRGPEFKTDKNSGSFRELFSIVSPE